MLQPLCVPHAALTKAGYLEQDIKDFSELARFLDTCETIGLGTSFSTLVSTLGKSKEMVSRLDSIFKRIQERNTV